MAPSTTLMAVWSSIAYFGPGMVLNGTGRVVVSSRPISLTARAGVGTRVPGWPPAARVAVAGPAGGGAEHPPCRASICLDGYVTVWFSTVMIATATEQLDAAFIALADPTRRAIVARLAHGDATVTELAKPFPMSMPAISKHLKVLERSGLITRSRHAQTRPCHLEREPLDAALDWIENSRRVWNARFDKLEAHLHTVQTSPSEKGSS